MMGELFLFFSSGRCLQGIFHAWTSTEPQLAQIADRQDEPTGHLVHKFVTPDDVQKLFDM
jgi:hypothetical protein